jgi:DNA-binding CsgD family transcriptional regulator
MEARLTPALETAERAHALAGQLGGLPAQASAMILGGIVALCGHTERVPQLVEQARPLLEGEALGAQPWLVAAFADSLTYSDDDLEARQVIGTTIEALRAASALGFLPYALAQQCRIEFRLGNWGGAYAAGSESVRLAEETGLRNEVSYSRVELAKVEAGYGRREECVRHAQAALAFVRETGVGSVGAHARAALGLLELGHDHPTEASEHLDQSERFLEGVGQPTGTRSMADRVEAHARAGKPAVAERVLGVLQEQAERTGGRWANAAAARCRGLLATRREFEEHFVDALGWHQQFPAPFEAARTQLCFGERLRRARRRIDARTPLRRALTTFERIGAEPWAEQARRELRATGERARRRAPEAVHRLTPQEVQVATQVAGGATNREAAAALFVSPKTIETHLNRVYRKLGVRSRTELARRLQAGPGQTVPAATPPEAT